MDISYIFERIEHLTNTLEILEGQNNDPNDEIEEKCIDLFTNLVIVKESINELRQTLDKIKEQHAVAEEKIIELKKLQQHINYVINNIPECTEPMNFEPGPLPTNAIEVAESNVSSPIPPSWNQLDSPCQVKSREELKITVKTKSFPNIDYITDEEFNTVPKYMKGRLTVTAVNKLIDSFNETLKKKYEIVKLPKRSIKTKDLDIYLEWKREENTEPRGTSFITGKDINTFGSIKMDKSVLNMITILRHLKRIKETRHPNGPVHYVIL